MIKGGMNWLKASCVLAFDKVNSGYLTDSAAVQFEIGGCTNISDWEKYSAAFFAVLHPHYLRGR